MKSLFRFRWSFGVTAFLLSSYLSAAEINGKVSKVADRAITVSSSSELLPAVGDKLDVFVEIPGVGKATVATGSVSSVKDEVIVAKIEKATGTIKVGQGVAIQSPKPTRRTRPNNSIATKAKTINPAGDCEIRAEAGNLTIDIPPGVHDLWYGHKNESYRFGAPRVLHEIEGDFVVKVKVAANWEEGVLPPKFYYGAAGLVIWDSPKQYLRWERNLLFNSNYGKISYVTPLYDQDEKRAEGWKITDPDEIYTGNSTWLKLERSGQQVTTSISHDGQQWTTTAVLTTEFPKKVLVGVHAIANSTRQFSAKFEHFGITRDASPQIASKDITFPIKSWGYSIDPDQKCSMEATPKKLKITVPAGVYDHWYKRESRNAPRVLQDVEGDFTAQVKVTANCVGPISNKGGMARAAGLLIVDSDNHYLRHERNRYVGTTDPRAATWFPPLYDRNNERITKWKATFRNHFQEESTWLRVRRTGQKVTTSVSHDGKRWGEESTLTTQFPRKVKVGVLAINNSGGEFRVTFEDFKLDHKEQAANKQLTSKFKVGDRVVSLYSRKLSGAGDGFGVRVGQGMVFTVEKINGDLLRITNGRPGWIDQSDVVPFNLKAIDRFTQLIAEDPKNPQLYCARGRLGREFRQYKQAVSDLSEAIRLKPKSASYFHERGYIQYEQGELDKSIVDYTEALRLLPNTVSFNGRGNTWVEKKEFDKAIADFNDSLRLDSKYTFAYAGRGLAWLKKGEYEKAISEISQAQRLDPQLPRTYNYFAWLRATCPDPKYRDGKLAIELATKACELSDWMDAICIDALAAAHAEVGDFDEAVKWQKKAIDLAYPRRLNDFRRRLELYRAGKPFREEGEVARVDDKHLENWGTIIDPGGDCRIKISPEKVTMTLPPGGHDLWYGSRVAAEKRFNAPRVLRTIKGDFVARVKVTADWKPGKNLASGRRTNAAGLLIWDSPRQYFRHERNVYAPRGAPDRQMSWVPPIYDKDEGRLSKWNAEPSTYFRGRSTWLMVQRKGEKLNSWISHDGKDWKFTGTYTSQFPDKVQVGILALNGSQSAFTVEFEDFRLTGDSVSR